MPPAVSSQATAPALPTVVIQPAMTMLPTVTINQTTLEQPSAPAQSIVHTSSALPSRLAQSTCQPSAPTRPLASIRPNPFTRLIPVTQHTVQASSAAPDQSTIPALASPFINPVLPPAPTQPGVSAQSTMPARRTAPASPTPPPQSTQPTRSTAPARSTGIARAARQTISNPQLNAGGKPRRRSRRAPPTGAGAPPPRQITPVELTELCFEVNKVVSGVAPFEIKYIGPRCYTGQKSDADIQNLLGLTGDQYDVVEVSRSTVFYPRLYLVTITLQAALKISLKRTPGINMSETIENQVSNFLVIRAIEHVRSSQVIFSRIQLTCYRFYPSSPGSRATRRTTTGHWIALLLGYSDSPPIPSRPGRELGEGVRLKPKLHWLTSRFS